METSYELSSGTQQPEISMTTINGRDVVIVDAELFTQIIDEIQNLKMKLSHLTHVIQVYSLQAKVPRDKSSLGQKFPMIFEEGGQ